MNDYQRIAHAINYIETHYEQQPDLASVAAHIGLSDYHFQGLFLRWAGISPKRFLQAVTADRAGGLLQEEAATVLETSYAVGLSGPGRLHDLTVNMYAMTPGEIRARGAGVTIHWGVHASPFGECLLADTERGIVGLHFLDAATTADFVLDHLRERFPLATLIHDDGGDGRTARTVAQIFDPVRDAAPLALWVKGTNFQVRVWEALLNIPAGQTSTYQQIAAGIGQPTAARAVGSAIGKNPVGFLIPCHRVIKATGAVGGYRWGETRKKVMLGWEAAVS